MSKKRSKIIKDLILNNIDILQALQSLNFILEDIDNEEIKNWVNKELNGYDEDSTIPQYREMKTTLIGDVLVNYGLYKNVSIPVTDRKAIDMFSKTQATEPVSVIMQLAKAENETESHSLSLEVNTVLVNKYQNTNGTVINAQRRLSLYSYNNVLAIIKDKLLEIFKVLENNYGNLDELYIDFSDTEKKEITIQNIIQIIHDNSTKIGSNNEISDSIIGDGNGN